LYPARYNPAQYGPSHSKPKGTTMTPITADDCDATFEQFGIQIHPDTQSSEHFSYEVWRLDPPYEQVGYGDTSDYIGARNGGLYDARKVGQKPAMQLRDKKYHEEQAEYYRRGLEEQKEFSDLRDKRYDV